MTCWVALALSANLVGDAAQALGPRLRVVVASEAVPECGPLKSGAAMNSGSGSGGSTSVSSTSGALLAVRRLLLAAKSAGSASSAVS